MPNPSTAEVQAGGVWCVEVHYKSGAYPNTGIRYRESEARELYDRAQRTGLCPFTGRKINTSRTRLFRSR